MSLQTFATLRDLIYEKSGIYFPENKKYLLDSRLESRLTERNCASFEEYVALLKTDGLREKELPELFNAVTTNETFLFRDLPQLLAFNDLILSEVIKENQETKRVRIWSAACSTGDEAYTLAILLLERGLELKGWNVEVAASDISEAALGSARRALYGTYAMRHVSGPLLRRYFTMEEGLHGVKPELKRLVRFAHINLFDTAQVRLMKGMDVIFCRNCLIYFDDKAKKRVVESFYDCLNPGGYLVIGFSETLHNVTRVFRPIPLNNTVIYKKAMERSEQCKSKP